MFLDSRASPDCHEDHDPGVVEAGGGGWQHVRGAAEDGHPGQSGQPAQLGGQTRRGQLIGGGHHLGGGAGQRGHLQTQGASDKVCMTNEIFSQMTCDTGLTRGLMMDVPAPLRTPHSAVTITLSGWRPAACSTPTTIFFILSYCKSRKEQ